MTNDVWKPLETAPMDGTELIFWVSSEKGFQDITANFYFHTANFYFHDGAWRWASTGAKTEDQIRRVVNDFHMLANSYATFRPFVGLDPGGPSTHTSAGVFLKTAVCQQPLAFLWPEDGIECRHLDHFTCREGMHSSNVTLVGPKKRDRKSVV